MIYIFTAIYPEAKALLPLLDLKKELDGEKYAQYYNEKKQIRLVIMGTGSIAAAICISHICTKYYVNDKDKIIHIGTCGVFLTNNPKKNVYICNKITQIETRKSFYPDILYQHDFLEGAIWTLPVVYNRNDNTQFLFAQDLTQDDKTQNSIVNTQNILVDMEAAGVYQAAIHYVGTGQIIILKVASDACEPQKVTPESIAALFMENGKDIVQFLDRLCRQQEMEIKEWSKPSFFAQNDWIEKVCQDMHCSETMKKKLKHLFYYMDITGIDYHKKIEQMYLDKKLPCRDKREGKKCYEQLEMELL